MPDSSQSSSRNVVLGSAAAALPSGMRNGIGAGCFVGVNRFVDAGLNPLRFAVNDAIDFAYAFVIQLLLLDPRRTYLAIDQDPADDQRRRKLEELLAAGVTRERPVRSALLYRLQYLADLPVHRLFVTLSTHGFVGSILPADGYSSLLDDTAISIDRIQNLLGMSQAQLQLVYIDACRNQPQVLVPGQKSAPLPSLSQMLESHEGRAVIRSCENRQCSYEFEELDNGLGAHYFLRALGLKERPPRDPVEELAEPLADGSITLAGVMSYTTSAAARFLAQPGRGDFRQSPCLEAPERLRELPLAIDPERADRLRQARVLDDQLIAGLRQKIDFDGGAFGAEQFKLARDLLGGKRSVPEARLANLRLRGKDFLAGIIDEETWTALVERIAGRAATPPRPAPVAVPSPAPVAPPLPPREWINSLGMKFRRIEPGRFRMGSAAMESERFDDETLHWVTLTRAYYMGVYHVTRGQFASFVSDAGYDAGDGWKNPGFEQDDDHPVVNVNWNDAQAFIAWLNRKDAPRHYRLPTEAEWEFACRNSADDTNPFNTGQTISTYQANYNGNYSYGSGKKTGVYRKGTTKVGSFPANARGLHDMHGNATQWCQDAYGPYGGGDETDPTGPQQQDANASRVLRGGSWYGGPLYCRSAFRDSSAPGDRHSNIGFRVVLDSP